MEVSQEPMFVDIETLQNQVKQENDLDTAPKPADDLMFENVLIPEQTDATNGSCHDNADNKQTDRTNLEPDGDKKHNCPVCSFSTADSGRLVRHIRKHKGENPYQCSMCEYSTYNCTLLKEHEFSHKGLKPYKCAHCPYRCNSKKNRNKHELRHRPDNPLKCAKCNFIARHRVGLKKHLLQHQDDATDSIDQYSCTECSFTCTTKTEHNAHKKKHGFHCRKCDFVGCNSVQLSDHKKEHKTTSRSRGPLFACECCEWSSSSKLKILLHLIHHPNQKVDEKAIDVSILKKYDIYKS